MPLINLSMIQINQHKPKLNKLKVSLSQLPRWTNHLFGGPKDAVTGLGGSESLPRFYQVMVENKHDSYNLLWNL